MSLDQALICAYRLGQSGPAAEVNAEEVEKGSPDTGWLWVHLDRTKDDAETWLRGSANLDPLAIEALLEEETRPRSAIIGDGLLVILRGVNLNVGADPEDMISIRIWIDASRVISLRRRKLLAVHDLRESIARGQAPATPGELLVEIAGFMIDRMQPVLEQLHDDVDQVEETVLDAPGNELRTKVSRLRRQAISLRRYLAPQREVIARLQAERTPLFTDKNRGALREITDRLTRYVEELDAARDRAAVTQEELGGRISEQMNRNMYVLSIVAGVFLPLGLLTGLLGINVGGMPGVENQWAFWIVCVILVAAAGVFLWLFRRLGLL